MSLDYIARCPGCGGITTWMSEQMAKRDLASEIAKAIEDGRSVERMETEEVRKKFGHKKEGCKYAPSRQRQANLLDSPGVETS